MDELMEDANGASSSSVPIKNLIKSVTNTGQTNQIHKFIDKTALDEIDEGSLQLQQLKTAVEETSELIERMGEGSQLKYYNLGTSNDFFLGLAHDSGYPTYNNFYVRDGYNSLLACMHYWWSRKKNRIVLMGNSGTGKSWYQLFVLRQLLTGDNNPGNKFRFVVRQVGASMFLIDLENCRLFQWTPDKLRVAMKEIINKMRNTLYMFEPGQEGVFYPMALYEVPSLCTLSPYIGRVKEYKKCNYKELYFWPWSFSEMNVVARTSFPQLDEKKLLDRHLYFGGILRHVLLTEDSDIEQRKTELQSRLLNVELKVLLNKYHDIDRDDSGNNVSGYILCYDGYESGQTEFDRKSLEYTSAFVRDKVCDIINAKSLEDKVDTVLCRLNDESVDLSGKCLEAVGTDMLRRGQDIKWVSKRIGTGEDYKFYKTTKREVTRLWDVGEKLRRPGQLLVSVNTNFPLADIVFSQPNNFEAHDVIQFTWQTSHPFSVRALYDLRVNRLQVRDTVTVNVYVVSPQKEERYAAMTKSDFLTGSLDVPFVWSSGTPFKQPPELRRMFDNTHLFVLKPKGDWNTELNHIRTNP